MEFIKVKLNYSAAEQYQLDLLVNAMGEIGFDTFDETENGIDAYIKAELYDETQLKECIIALDEPIDVTFTAEKVISVNWNEEWEKNFTPLIVNEDCYVRATFHSPQPQYQYEIVIDPKMAFGTGHHETTTMMMQYILEAELTGKHVLDMGCGTGILAILAAKRGADPLVAIDNDEVCYESTLENSALNNVDNITAACGGKEVIPDTKFDTILANINRNILLDQIPVYANVLKAGGSIYFSGFYENPDLDMIREKCSEFNIRYISHKKKGDWVAAFFKKD